MACDDPASVPRQSEVLFLMFKCRWSASVLTLLYTVLITYMPHSPIFLMFLRSPLSSVFINRFSVTTIASALIWFVMLFFFAFLLHAHSTCCCCFPLEVNQLKWKWAGGKLCDNKSFCNNKELGWRGVCRARPLAGNTVACCKQRQWVLEASGARHRCQIDWRQAHKHTHSLCTGSPAEHCGPLQTNYPISLLTLCVFLFVVVRGFCFFLVSRFELEFSK